MDRTVIPVQSRRAPRGFNSKVLRPGRRWLKKQGFPRSGPVPVGVELKPFWRECLEELHSRYGGVCAYVCIYIDKVTGARTADHFVAKSKAIEHAYRWSNYRLACLRMNQRKSDFSDVLDPFEIQPDTFRLSLMDGSIEPSPTLPPELHRRAKHTIDRLGLDEEDCRIVRREYYEEYVSGNISEDYLRRRCPFVWYEARRQGLI